MSAQTETQVNTVDTTSQHTTTTVSQLLQSLVEMSATQAQAVREMHKNLKRLAAEVEKEAKKIHKTKPKRTVTQKAVTVQPAMTAFLQKQKVDAVEGGYTRQIMMKAVSAYIKANKLQVEGNMKQWKPDATLTKLFDLDKNQVYTFMNINGLLSRVVIQPNASA